MKKNKKLIIFGSGKFADFIAYSFEIDSEYKVSAFCVEENFLSSNTNTEFQIPIVCFEKIKELYPPENYQLFIAIGNDKVRENKFEQAKQKGYSLPTFISSNANCSPNLILEGENIFIGEASFIQPFVTIQSNTYIIGARIGHHSLIKKNSLLSACLLGAEVEVNQNSFIGLNATIRPKIKIAKNNIIGMGAVINNSTRDFEVYSAPSAVKRTLSYKQIADNFL